MAEQPPGSRTTGRVKPTQDLKEALAAHAPWYPVTFTVEEVGALQAAWRGDAAGHQQRIAIECIIRICRNDGAIFFPGEDGRRSTDFALGRAFVGEQITTILKVKPKRGDEHG